MNKNGWLLLGVVLLSWCSRPVRSRNTNIGPSTWEDSVTTLGLESTVDKDLSVFENGMQRVGSSFAMLIKAAMAQSKKRNQQKNEVNTRELKGQEKVEQQSKAEDSLVLESRSKRFINLPAAWKVIYHEFPKTVHNVMENAEIRYDAERKNIIPIDYSSLNSNSGQLYLTETSDQPNPLVPTSFGDTIETLSQKSYISKAQRYQTNFDNTPLPQTGYPAYSMLTKRETATTFDPSKLHQILGKGSSSGITHYSKVKDVERKEKPINSHEEDKAELEIPKASVTSPVKAQPFNSKFKIFRRSAIGLNQEEENNFDVAEKIIQTSTNSEDALLKMINAGKSFDKALQQILGNQDIEMFKKIVDESQKEAAEVENEKLVEHLNVQRRSTNEDRKEQLAKAVEKFQQVMNSVVENPGNRFADINKMLNAENELDLAVHKVLGNKHEDDATDVEMMEKILKEEKMPNYRLEKRSKNTEMEDAFKRSVDNMKAVNKILEHNEGMEKALEALIKADHDITNIVDTILGPTKVEKLTHARRKRAHGVGYYDPEYQWLVKELDLPINDQINLHKLETVLQNGRQSSNPSESSLYTKDPSVHQYNPEPTPSYNRGSSDQYHQPNQYPYPEKQSPQFHESSGYFSQGSHQHSEPSFQYGDPTGATHNTYSAYEQNSEFPSQDVYDLSSDGSYKTRYSKPISFNSQSYLNQQNSHDYKTEKGTLESLVDSLTPLRNAIPTEIEAAYHGVVEVGKHVGKRIKPFVETGYRNVAYRYIPQARRTFNYAVESVPEDIKDFARQGRKIVESRAIYASEVAKPRMKSLQESLWLLQEQLKQVAQETGEYTSREVVPALIPAIQGLLFDVQETLELASNIVEEDVKPFVGTMKDDVIKPTYEELTSKVVYPAAQTMSDYVFNPVASSVNDYVVEPISESARPAYDKYAVPAYQSARHYAGSAISGVNSAAESSKVVYQESVRPRLETFAENSKAVYKESVQPRLENLSISTSQVLQERVKPAVSEAAAAVGERAARIGGSIKDDVVPPLQEGLKNTLNSVFTGIPSLVQKLSYEAHDAAKIFSGKYSQSLENLKVKENRRKLEEEIKLSMIRKAEEDEKNRIRNMEYNAEMQYKDKNGEEVSSDEEATIEDVNDGSVAVETSSKSTLERTTEAAREQNSKSSVTTEAGENSVTEEPGEEYKTSTEL